MRGFVLVVLVGCHGGAPHSTLATLRPACPPTAFWDGTACKPRGDGAAKIAAGKAALAKQDVDEAKVALDAADKGGGPLDHDAIVTLWEQRGIAAAYADDDKAAISAFDMMLALEPNHLLSYTLSPKATFVFQRVREDKTRVAPAVDIDLPHGQKVGEPVPLELDVVADPKKFLHRATVFVRTRGERDWRAADLPLTAKDKKLVLPPVDAHQPVSLEVYLRAYDDRGNEVLTWADPQRPREIPLRYDPPPPWYERKEFLIPAGLAALIGVGVTVYALTLSPPDKIGGPVTVAK